MAFCLNLLRLSTFFFSGETGLVVLVFFKDYLSLKKILFKINYLLFYVVVAVLSY